MRMRILLLRLSKAWILASDLFETRVLESFIEYSETVKARLVCDARLKAK